MIQSTGTPIKSNAASSTDINQNERSPESSSPKFADVFKQFQAKFGEKPQKPREIKKTLGKDDFLNIMITQMKNQDPTNPFKAEQMASEMAQYASVEQLQNVNQNLNKMSEKNKPLERMSMTNLIGKTVTIDKQRFPHLEGEVENLSFNLSRSSTLLKAVIIDGNGEEIAEKELGAQPAGEVSFNWDGLKKNTLPAKSGEFTLKVQAKDEKGRIIETNPRTTGKVIGVSFEGNEPIFLVGDAQHQDKVTMQNMVRIEMDGLNEVNSKPKTDGKTKIPLPHSNLGSRSNELRTSELPKIEKNSVSEAKPRIELEKGFPNGLNELNETGGGIKNE